MLRKGGKKREGYSGDDIQDVGFILIFPMSYRLSPSSRVRLATRKVELGRVLLKEKEALDGGQAVHFP